MADKGHVQTDDILAEIERKIDKEYSQASKEVTEKYKKYMKRFEADDAIKRLQVEQGTLSQDEYERWRYGKVCIGQRWKDLKDQLAQDLTNTDMKARSVVQGYMPEVYALNHNYATYQVEHDSLMDLSYTLYNRRAVENLIRDDASLLPYPRTDSPTARKLMERADLIWNRQHISNALTQGILQGESIPDIARRLVKVVGMDRSAAIRNARTMMTGTQNKARQDAFDDARKKGIKLREKWLATLDSRTRHSHRHLHGTYKDPDTGLYANDLEYPGDPNGEPEEIYNCRCTEIAEVDGFAIETPKTSPKLGTMTYEEWLNEHGENPYADKLQVQTEQTQTQTQQYTLKDVGQHPVRPKLSDYGDDYSRYEADKAKYKEERDKWNERNERFIRESIPERSMSVAEMREWADRNNCYIYGDISAVDGRAFTLFTNRYEQLFRDFPMVQEYRKEHGYQGKFNISFENEGFVAEASSGFTFGRPFTNLEDLLRYEVSSDYVGEYRVIGDGTINQIFDHEFGHNVYNAMQLNGFERDKYGGLTRENLDHIQELRADLIQNVYKKNGMSEYAGTNDDELFAEAFSAWYGGETTDFANAMGDYLKRHGVVK